MSSAAPENTNTTTADSWNRQRDKQRVETLLQLPEHGDPTVRLAAVTDPDTVLSTGMNRVVYGDHGAYVELEHQHVNWAAFPIKNEEKNESVAFYSEFFTADKSVMLYGQLKRVGATPPAGGVKVAGRESYADYVPGKFYLSVRDVTRLKPAAQSSKSGAGSGGQPRKKSRLQ